MIDQQTQPKAADPEGPSPEDIARERAYSAQLREGLLKKPADRSVLRTLLLRGIQDGKLWFEEAGFLARIEATAPKEEFLADFIVALLFPSTWPPEPETEDAEVT